MSKVIEMARRAETESLPEQVNQAWEQHISEMGDEVRDPDQQTCIQRIHVHTAVSGLVHVKRSRHEVLLAMKYCELLLDHIDDALVQQHSVDANAALKEE